MNTYYLNLIESKAINSLIVVWLFVVDTYVNKNLS